jgi:hypothetical protein
MRFDLETSKLVYEVRFHDKDCDDIYTYEQLFRDVSGKYFMHFIASKHTQYAIKTGYLESVGREGNFYIDTYEIDLWKRVSNTMFEKRSDEYTIIDWEKEENENLLWMGHIAEEKLPF